MCLVQVDGCLHVFEDLSVAKHDRYLAILPLFSLFFLLFALCENQIVLLLSLDHHLRVFLVDHALNHEVDL